MRRIQIILLLICTAHSIHAQDSKKVLFIGNSYTAANDLPGLVNQIATSMGDMLIYDTHTPGGATLSNHASNATAESKINSTDWDYVTLQAQSQEPSWGINQVSTQVFPYAKLLCDKIRLNNQCSVPLFYMTWGRENGDGYNCASLPSVCTYEGMDDQLNLRYQMMGEDNSASVSPVGAAWRYLRDNNLGIDLYSGDGSHPSLAGSYTAAVTFYTMIYKKDPTGITFESSLSSANAIIIKNAVKQVVFDVLDDWIWKDETLGFEIERGPRTVSFNPLPHQNGSYSWDFGDGTTSTSTSPTHVYDAAGAYMVTMQRVLCGDTFNMQKSVTVIDTPDYGQSCASPYVLHKPTDGDTIFSVDNTMRDQYYSYTAKRDEIINFSSWCTTDLNTWLYVYRNACDPDSLVYSVDDDRFFQNEFISRLDSGNTFIFRWDDEHHLLGGFQLIFDVKFSVSEYVDLSNCLTAPEIVQGQNKIYNVPGFQFYAFSAPANGSISMSNCNYTGSESGFVWLINNCSGNLLGSQQYCGVNDHRSILEYNNIKKDSTYYIVLGEPSRFECQVYDFFDFTFTPENTTYDSLSICDGDSIYAEGAWQHDAGTYWDVLVTNSGKDSIIATTLTINPVYDIIENVSICPGENHTYPDGSVETNITINTSHESILTSMRSGCDSLVTTNVRVDEACIREEIVLGGYIKTQKGEALANVAVNLSGSSDQSTFTDEFGWYSFDVMTHQDFHIQPTIVTEADDGVTTLDIAIMHWQILGIKNMMSNYDFIAGDVNDSHTLTALDISETRAVILHTKDQFEDRNSVVFINHEYTGNPSVFEYSNYLDILPLQSQMNLDFTAVKLGDTGKSWNPKQNAGRRAGALDDIKIIFDQAQIESNRVTIPFLAQNFSNIVGLQFTLEWNPNVYSYDKLTKGQIEFNYNLNMVDDGKLTVSWNSNEKQGITFENNVLLSEIGFTSLNTSDDPKIEITSNITPALAFNSALETMGVIGSINPNVELIINELDIFPNPANDLLYVSELKTGNYKFSILSTEGKEVLSGGFFEGNLINITELKNGMYMLQIIDEENNVRNKKFIKQ